MNEGVTGYILMLIRKIIWAFFGHYKSGSYFRPRQLRGNSLKLPLRPYL